MITAVTLQVAGVDIQDHARASLLGEHFADLLWASVDGLVTCTVYLDGGDITAQVTQVARAIEHRISGASVIRVHRDLVTQSDIASRVGVSREAVRKWTQRPTAPLFPAPFDTVGGVGRPSKVWQWAEVVPWLRDAYDLTVDDDELPDAETVAHIDACLARVRSYLDRAWQTAAFATSEHPVVAVNYCRLSQPSDEHSNDLHGAVQATRDSVSA